MMMMMSGWHSQVRGRNTGQIRSRVSLRPVESQGCWLSDNFLVSSNLQYLSSNISANKLLINKVSEDSLDDVLIIIIVKVNFTAESSHNLVNERDLYKVRKFIGH